MARRLSRTALAIACALVAGARADVEPTVILLSMDGVRHDYPDRGALPALARMQREGGRAERLVPVFPSSTFPNHVSLATGTHPDRHGIVDNEFRDRARGLFERSSEASWIRAEPLWVAAERQGVSSAVYFWVGSESDWNGIGATRRMTPFDPEVGEAAKVEQILDWLDLPDRERPQLVMAWWHGADRAGHRGGPDDPSVLAALQEQDAHLGSLLDALDARGAWKQTTLMVVSDHGMTRAHHRVPLRETLEKAAIPADVQSGNAVAHVFLDEPIRTAAAIAALRTLEGVSLYERERMPVSLRSAAPDRVGDVVVIAHPPHVFVEGGLRRIAATLGLARGAHGYPPDHPDMAGVLFAMGRGVEPGSQLGAVHAIDVAPTVARLLGIAPPRDAEGDPIEGIGSNAD